MTIITMCAAETDPKTIDTRSKWSGWAYRINELVTVSRVRWLRWLSTANKSLKMEGKSVRPMKKVDGWMRACDWSYRIWWRRMGFTMTQHWNPPIKLVVAMFLGVLVVVGRGWKVDSSTLQLMRGFNCYQTRRPWSPLGLVNKRVIQVAVLRFDSFD